MDVAVFKMKSKCKQKQLQIRNLTIHFPYMWLPENLLLSSIISVPYVKCYSNTNNGKDLQLYRIEKRKELPLLLTNFDSKPPLHYDGKIFTRTNTNKTPVKYREMSMDLEHLTSKIVICYFELKNAFLINYVEETSKRKDLVLANNSLYSPTHNYIKQLVQYSQTVVKNCFIITIIADLFVSYFQNGVVSTLYTSWRMTSVHHGFLIKWLLKQMHKLIPLTIICNNFFIVVISPFKPHLDLEFIISIMCERNESTKLCSNNIKMNIHLPIIIKNNEHKEANTIIEKLLICDNVSQKRRYIPIKSVLKEFTAMYMEEDTKIINNFIKQKLNFNEVRKEKAGTYIKDSMLYSKSWLSNICNNIVNLKEFVVNIIEANNLEHNHIVDSVTKCTETVKDIIMNSEYYIPFLKQLAKTLAYTLFTSVNVNF